MGCVRRRFQASFSFLQDADDLFFGESLFHCRSSLERTYTVTVLNAESRSIRIVRIRCNGNQIAFGVPS